MSKIQEAFPAKGRALFESEKGDVGAFNAKYFGEIPTIDLPETYSVGVSFGTDYDNNIIGANVVVMKREADGKLIVVHSEFHRVK